MQAAEPERQVSQSRRGSRLESRAGVLGLVKNDTFQGSATDCSWSAALALRGCRETNHNNQLNLCGFALQTGAGGARISRRRRRAITRGSAIGGRSVLLEGTSKLQK